MFIVRQKLNQHCFSAADWPKTPLWTGKLKIISRGRDALVILWEEKNGEIAVFAKCPVTEGSIEKGIRTHRARTKF